eukprot:CAMPEP_0170457266 /NCGR_PEP_ID=MMETSP0123-20130129/4616_1 /TAXON_ID=182087 /ORGANISM="Favella ehrenbergii, Strain Fehren 1" /LENGTH=53 /DNA_ID=CAMNT_0010721003 /DNA_START=1091 /DNA_END=1249 /DNA_ORIENTATION=-
MTGACPRDSTSPHSARTVPTPGRISIISAGFPRHKSSNQELPRCKSRARAQAS